MRSTSSRSASSTRRRRAMPYGHACEPRIARLADGTILLSHRAGTRRESADGRPHFLRSRDEGRTWEDLGRPFDDGGGDRLGPARRRAARSSPPATCWP